MSTPGGSGRALLAHNPRQNPTVHSFAAGRAVLHANLQHEGQTFSVYDPHIGWNAEGDLQARELADTPIARDTNPYLVMTGDFNDEHYSPQATIIEAYLAEAMFAAGLFPGRISLPATGSEGSQLIDLVFYAPPPHIGAPRKPSRKPRRRTWRRGVDDARRISSRR